MDGQKNSQLRKKPLTNPRKKNLQKNSQPRRKGVAQQDSQVNPQKNRHPRLKGGQCGAVPSQDTHLGLLCQKWDLIDRLKKIPPPTSPEWVPWRVSQVYPEKNHPSIQAPVAKSVAPQPKRLSCIQKYTNDALEPICCSGLFEVGKDNLSWYGIGSDVDRPEVEQFNRKMAKSLQVAGLVAKPPEPKERQRDVPGTLCLRKEFERMLKMRSRAKTGPESIYLAREVRTRTKQNTRTRVTATQKQKKTQKQTQKEKEKLKQSQWKR
ncbi:uncharacterized protein [Drosophila bipectinata]|uniref:uncharacterized protein isoform X1 n=1 Tax=Drosophila bipectinata TaxID=42026 RepID=UPI001C8B03A9|nr:uncharacterized protein LOC108118629 isoform X1 [Drosophila bipectinata]